METISSHVGIDTKSFMMDSVKKMAEDHAKLGVKYCIQAVIFEEERKTVAGYQKVMDGFNQIGKIMKENGVQFGYHNHNFEFDTVEGKVPYYDIMLGEADSNLIIMEIDLFWAIKAGQNPVDIFKKHPGRFPLFHMKDMFTEEPPRFTTIGVSDFAPVGSGVINFREILAAKDIAGMKYMIVEQDFSKDGTPFNDIQTSFTNLKTKILV